jgi:hypothetical protein
VWTEERPTSLRARVLCLVLRGSHQKDEHDARVSRAHLHGQSWNWKELVAELCVGAVFAGWLRSGAGESQESGFLCFSGWRLYSTKESAAGPHGFPEKSVFLFDPDENVSHPLESNVFTIVASSPQKKHYGALLKENSSVRYFPCWSLAELQRAAPTMNQD